MVSDDEKKNQIEKVKARIEKLRSLIDMIDAKIEEKISDDMVRVRITTSTAEREMEGYSLRELREIKESYVLERIDCEKNLAVLEGKGKSRMIRPVFKR